MTPPLRPPRPLRRLASVFPLPPRAPPLSGWLSLSSAAVSVTELNSSGHECRAIGNIICNNNDQRW